MAHAPAAPRQYTQSNRVFVSGILNEIFIDEKKPKDVLQADGTTKSIIEKHIYGYIHCTSNDTQSLPKQVCFLIPTPEQAKMLAPFEGKRLENIILDNEYQAASVYNGKVIPEKNNYVFFATLEEMSKSRIKAA